MLARHVFDKIILQTSFTNDLNAKDNVDRNLLPFNNFNKNIIRVYIYIILLLFIKKNKCNFIFSYFNKNIVEYSICFNKNIICV